MTYPTPAMVAMHVMPVTCIASVALVACAPVTHVIPDTPAIGVTSVASWLELLAGPWCFYPPLPLCGSNTRIPNFDGINAWCCSDKGCVRACRMKTHTVTVAS